MTEQGYYWDEVLPEIIEVFNWDNITQEQWDRISDDLNEHVSVAREFMAPVPSARDLADYGHRDEINALKRRVEELESLVGAYNNDIVRVKGGKYTSIDPSSRRVIIHD